MQASGTSGIVFSSCSTSFLLPFLLLLSFWSWKRDSFSTIWKIQGDRASYWRDHWHGSCIALAHCLYDSQHQRKCHPVTLSTRYSTSTGWASTASKSRPRNYSIYQCLSSRHLSPKQTWEMKWRWDALHSASSDTRRDILIKDSIKGILHCQLKAAKSIVDAPKATFHSILNESECNAENQFLIWIFTVVLKTKRGNLVLQKSIFRTCSQRVRM